MGKIKKAVTNTLIGLGITGAVYAQNPKIDTIASTQKDLTENIKNNRNIIETDEETEKILSFASGFGDEKMSDLLKKYGHTPFEIDSLNTRDKDPILYETMKDLNQKYGNPKITIKWSEISNISGAYCGRFSVSKNTIHLNPQLIGKNNKIFLIKVWLGELSHSKQFQQGHMTWREIKDGITFIKKGFKYDNLYDEKGTIEYDAHQIIEPEMAKEFIETYISKIDTNNIQEIKKAEYYISCMVTDSTKEQMDKKNKNLQFILEKERQEILAINEKKEKRKQEKLALNKKWEDITQRYNEILKRIEVQASQKEGDLKENMEILEKLTGLQKEEEEYKRLEFIWKYSK